MPTPGDSHKSRSPKGPPNWQDLSPAHSQVSECLEFPGKCCFGIYSALHERCFPLFLSLVKCISERRERMRYRFRSVPGQLRGSRGQACLWRNSISVGGNSGLPRCVGSQGTSGWTRKGIQRGSKRTRSRTSAQHCGGRAAHSLTWGAGSGENSIKEGKRSPEALALQQSSGHPRTSSDTPALPPHPQAQSLGSKSSSPAIPPPCRPRPPSWIRLRESPAGSRE